MDISRNYEHNIVKFFGTIFEEWRIFDMLKEKHAIEKNILPWIYACWIQIGVLFLFLFVTFVLLKRESMKLNREVLVAKKGKEKKDVSEKRMKCSNELSFNAKFHDAVKQFYLDKNSVCYLHLQTTNVLLMIDII